MTIPVEDGIRILPLRGIGEIESGDDLGRMLVEAATSRGYPPRDGDILVVTQKAVSKAEGCVVRLEDVEPSRFAMDWAAQWGKDPRQVEVVLRECQRIVRMDHGVLIVETRHGYICANAGVDASNVAAGVLTLLPPDPDASAARIRTAVREHAEAEVGVIVSDTFGRPWREGQTDIAIGVSGLRPLRSYVGEVDPAGYELRVTAPAVADELAGAAELVMGKLERVPSVLIRGLPNLLGEGSALELVRSPTLDLFR